MQAVIIVESCFGNTAAVAGVMAEGLAEAGATVQTIAADQAPAEVNADLILVAAPTHNGGLPKAKTRTQATQKGATGAPTSGVREWIAGLERLNGKVLTVATTDGGKYSGSAGRAIVKALRRLKIPAEIGRNFLVTGRSGPMAGGELERARDWARALAT